jgi:hypothetical protein
MDKYIHLSISFCGLPLDVPKNNPSDPSATNLTDMFTRNKSKEEQEISMPLYRCGRSLVLVVVLMCRLSFVVPRWVDFFFVCVCVSVYLSLCVRMWFRACSAHLGSES